jgi:hypothetical protein
LLLPALVFTHSPRLARAAGAAVVVALLLVPALAAAKPEPITIGRDGAVGIHNAEPQATLDVNGFAKLSPNEYPPVTCDAAHKGVIALTREPRLCLCNGTSWIFDATGAECRW